MEFQKDTKNFSLGFSSQRFAGTGSISPLSTNIKADADTLAVGENFSYKGIGCISCGSSSRLLLDYKAMHHEVYLEILRLLFETGYGAGISHLKLELGADVNSSSGTEPSAMRSCDECPDVTRGAGFIIAADALKINPRLTVDLLRWGEPAWVKKAFEQGRAEGFKARYKWYKDTIDAAYSKFGIRFTHISPDASDTSQTDSDWIIYFTERLKSEKNTAYDYSAIKIVASDETDSLTVAREMSVNAAFRNVVDIIGLHYTTYGNEDTERMCREYGKEIWYSEGIAPSNIPELAVRKDNSGLAGENSAVDFANRIINGMAHSGMTMYEIQPAVSSYYDGSCYYPKHLIRANEPWSGHYEIGVGLYAAMHFTRFVKKGWQPVRSACFGDGDEKQSIKNTTANYIMLMPEDRSEMTLVVTNDGNRKRSYNISFENCDFSGRQIAFIETASPENGEKYNNNWFRCVAVRKIKENRFSFDVKPHSIITVTTMKFNNEVHVSETWATPPEKKRLTLPYKDNFSYPTFKEGFIKNRGGTPLYTTDIGGAFEVVSVDGKNYLEQKITKDIIPCECRFGNTPAPITCLGDDTWANYTAFVTVQLEKPDVNNYVGIGVRYNSSVACEKTAECGFSAKVYGNGEWKILFMDRIIESGTLSDFKYDEPHIMSVTSVGNLYIAYLDGKMLGSYTESGVMQVCGRISLMSGYFRNRFTDIEINPIPSMSTYVTNVDALSRDIYYYGNITMNAMDTYKYSNRTNTVMRKDSGAAIKYSGCGFALCGTVSSAVISILLDGKIIADKVKVGGTAYRQAFYRFDSCDEDMHNIQVQVEDGEIVFDSLACFTTSEEYGTTALYDQNRKEKKSDSGAVKKSLIAAGTVAAALVLKGVSKKRNSKKFK